MRTLTTLLLCLLFHFADCQKEIERFYVFDGDWKPTDIKKAVFMLHVHKTDESLWEWDYYNMFGPMVKMETFKDEDAKVRHGMWAYFNTSGSVDSSGHFFEGKPDKTWYFRGPKGKVLRSRDYDKGEFIKETDIEKSDSLAAVKKAMDSANGIKGNKDSLAKVEIESEFPGGAAQWLRFMSKNMRYPERAVNSNIQGQVLVNFIVGSDGKISEPQIIKSVEYSLDAAALELIKKSPDWVPAVQNGRKVKSFKVQPIVFTLEAN